MVFLLLSFFEEILHFLSFSSPRESSLWQHVKRQLTDFPRKGSVHSFMVSAVVSVCWLGVSAQWLCSMLGCLSVGARRACTWTASDIYIVRKWASR